MKLPIILSVSIGLAAMSFAEPVHYTATNLWKVDVGYLNQSSPTQATNGVLYVTTWKGRLHAINADGSPRWTFDTRFESVSSPAVGDDGTIYFGSRNRRFYAVDVQGRKQWDFKTGGWVDASAAIGSDGTIYFGSWDKTFYALGTGGEQKWELATGGPITSSAAIDAAGSIYFGSHDRKFYALNPDGSKRWELVTGGAIISSPALGDGGTIYFTSLDGELRAVTPEGTVQWRFRTGSTTQSSPVIGQEGEILVAGNTHFFAVNADGTLRWQWPLTRDDTEPLAHASGLVLAGGNVIIVPGAGLMFELSGGKDWIWNYWLSGQSASSPVIGADGTVYAMGLGGQLHAIARKVPLASSPWPMFRGNPQRTGRVTTEL